MTVNITISDVSGSDSLADTVDMGELSPGGTTTPQDLFIRHDASASPITDCAFYLTRYAGSSYLGSDVDDDYTEVMGWGAVASEGFQVNQVIPPGWTTGTAFGSGDWQRFRTGYGDIDNQLILDEDSINIGTPAGDGIIPLAGEAHVQVKLVTPSSIPAGAGYRAVHLVMAYSATS